MRTTKYEPLIHFIAEQSEDAVTLSFAEIAAIVGTLLPQTMRVDASKWTSIAYAYVWRLRALGWRARLDRGNRCVHFTREEREG